MLKCDLLVDSKDLRATLLRLKKDEEFNKNFKLAIVETASLLAIIFAKTKDVVVTKDLIKKSKEESFTNMKKMFLEASEKDIAQFSKEFLILSKSILVIFSLKLQLLIHTRK